MTQCRCLSLHLNLGHRQEGPPSVFGFFFPALTIKPYPSTYLPNNKKVSIFLSTHHFFNFRFVQNPGGEKAGLFRRSLPDDERTKALRPRSQPQGQIPGGLPSANSVPRIPWSPPPTSWEACFRISDHPLPESTAS